MSASLIGYCWICMSLAVFYNHTRFDKQIGRNIGQQKFCHVENISIKQSEDTSYHSLKVNWYQRESVDETIL